MTSLSNTLGLTATGISLWLSGAISSISIITIPNLSASSISNHQALQIWHVIYEQGKAQARTLAVVAALFHIGSSALRTSSWRQISRRRLLAAGLTVAIAPFTATVMASTNNPMIAGAVSGRGVGVDNARALLGTWTGLNIGRSLLPLAAGVLGLLCVRDGA